MNFVLQNSNFEAVKLQWKHFVFNLYTNNPYRLPYFSCILTDRKGWQKQVDEPQLRGELDWLAIVLVNRY